MRFLPSFPPKLQASAHARHFIVAIAALFASISAQSEEIEWSPSETTLGTDPTEATLNALGGGQNLNTFLGATRYYNNSTPITGQNTITYNMEAGHIWAGHESLQHVTQFFNTTGAYGGGPVGPLVDRHATAIGMLIGGRPTVIAPLPSQSGIAPNTNLRSAAVAEIWTGTRYSTEWGLNGPTYFGALDAAFKGTYNGAVIGDPSVRSPDVINSSYGIGTFYGPPNGSGQIPIVGDALAWKNPYTTWVNAAGNNGPNANTVVAPAAGYNTISVGALTKGNNAAAPYDTVATFSSRGPQSFSFSYGSGTIAGVRAVVDISAPGDQITSAYYGGTTGGNHAEDANLTGPASGIAGTPSTYSPAPLSGTSYAAPLVAGGAALITSAARTLPGMSSNLNATQSVVVKSLLLSGADKTAGWTNDLKTFTDVGNDTFLRTTQSLDWATGAGRMNLDRTFELQTTGTMDVPGTGTGLLGTGLLTTVDPIGWDYGKAVVGAGNFNDYVFSTPFNGMTEFNTTLSWLRYRSTNLVNNYPSPIEPDDLAQANLDVSFWSVVWDGLKWQFADKVAESSSLYNVVEHLSFRVPATGRYGLRVSYPANTFDETPGDVWGSVVGLNDYSQPYGLAWSLTAVPEPSAMIPHAALLAAGLSLRSRRSRKELLRP
jgi:hypothetical protein